MKKLNAVVQTCFMILTVTSAVLLKQRLRYGGSDFHNFFQKHFPAWRSSLIQGKS